MAQVKEADKVAINFIGTLADGTIIDSTYPDPDEDACNDEDCCHEHGPMELTLGEGDFYTPIETALIGMRVGDKKTVVVAPVDAFGEHDPENVFSIKPGEFPEDILPEVGLELEVTGDDDDLFMVTIIEVTDDEIVLDSNHPLAGEELTYEIELVKIF
ncbi:FKBP-type peptidyl-prolyl cis-trans isomerase [Geopsychrobacter electrodiphilus]|uniref:FKBP-type peptidyl-prolyl cis-trans isomerase n=1 Tax=Geopsychrobacter electrodiphilus TaxID=225196 RepID=UPI00037EBD6B|nr:FKBP-type peptidyl-prolyl cis-trans isomerase [Geopsychrobacter electrodiphilus]